MADFEVQGEDCWLCFVKHIDVEAGFQSSKSTIAETGMGVTSRP